MRKIVVITLLSTLTLLLSCGGPNPKTSEIDDRKLFRIHCVNCHGVDGRLGDNGAKDLSQSPLSLHDRIQIISNGRNLMTPFSGVLNKKEIEAVAKYTFKLK